LRFFAGFDAFAATGVGHVGVGERACVDTCSYLGQDEGILVGSQARGMILCASETHPLPYMPTRPFWVNAGAIMSYTLAEDGRPRYLSELRAGPDSINCGNASNWAAGTGVRRHP